MANFITNELNEIKLFILNKVENIFCFVEKNKFQLIYKLNKIYVYYYTIIAYFKSNKMNDFFTILNNHVFLSMENIMIILFFS